MIQITPQMRILVAIEAVDGRHRLTGPIVSGETAGGSLLRMLSFRPQSAGNVDPHPGL